MPTKPTPDYQTNRTNRRVSITLSPEALEHAEAIRERTDLLHLSAVIAWALERACREGIGDRD